MLKIIGYVVIGFVSIVFVGFFLIFSGIILKDLRVAIKDYIKKGSDDLLIMLFIGWSVIVAGIIYPIVMKIDGMSHIAGLIISFVIYIVMMYLINKGARKRSEKYWREKKEEK